MKSEFRIGSHFVGLQHPTYFIADIASNYDGDLGRAKDLIYKCAEYGANAVKFQNFKANSIVSDYGFNHLMNQVSHQLEWPKSVYETYNDASLPMQWTQILKETCDDAGVDYLTAPYDLSLIPELSNYVCAWKLGSGDITWHENIMAMASDGKPLLIATGASSLNEVRMAMQIAIKNTDRLVLMQCNTNYTASLDNFKYISLNVLKAYEREFPEVVLGLSDHTPGHTTVIGAVTLGARVIEKHFTDDCSRNGPDHKFSMDPIAWHDMVYATRELEAALGLEEKHVMDNEIETVVIQRRGIRADKFLKSGKKISNSDLVSLRPCSDDCLPPYRIKELIGKTLKKDIEKGDCVKLSDID
jgi:sialic acid synthase SpsE